MEFVLLGSILGVDPDTNPVDPFDETAVREDCTPLLEACLRRDIPIICANPDVYARNGLDAVGNTKLLNCPGYIGQIYDEMGDQVLYFGKPFKSIYEYLVENKAKGSIKNGDEESSKRVVCVGNNMATDIKGATEAGIDVVMILGGVHWGELKDAKDDDELNSRVRKLCMEFGSQEPTYLMKLLIY